MATPSAGEQLLGTVRGALARAGLAGRNATLVAAVSGGPDSLAMLHALHTLQDVCGIRLHVAHLDHALRPESAADAAFVAAATKAMGLGCTADRTDVASYHREHHLSLEDAARRVRHAFLRQVARDTNAAAIALAHTADDQAETLLLHIMRGAGLAGLRGMSELDHWQAAQEDSPAVAVFRPLLSVGRETIEAACDEWELAPRRDPSNLSLRFARNRVRHRVLPELRRINPSIREALARLGEAATRDLSLIEAQVEAAWPRVARELDGDGVELDSIALTAQHPALRSATLRRAWAVASGSPADLTEAHLEALDALLGAGPGKVAHLPHGLIAVTGYGQLLLGPDVAALCPYPPLAGEHPLRVPGTIAAGPWAVEAAIGKTGSTAGPGLQVRLTAALIDKALVLRAWKPGDRIRLSGGTKKLQDLFVDMKVPRFWRKRVPLLVAGEEVVWVAGHRVAHGAQGPRGAKALLVQLALLEGR